MKNINKVRFAELDTLAREYASGSGFEPLQDSISGASLATHSFVGHLLLTDDKLNEIELVAFQSVCIFLDVLAEKNKND